MPPVAIGPTMLRTQLQHLQLGDLIPYVYTYILEVRPLISSMYCPTCGLIKLSPVSYKANHQFRILVQFFHLQVLLGVGLVAVITSSD